MRPFFYIYLSEIIIKMSGLSDFIKLLEKNNELIRVTKLVNTELEITEIVDRISKQPGGGKAILFENTNTNFPVLINAFGSEKRIALALGVNNLNEINNKIDEVLTIAEPKKNLIEKLKVLPKLKGLSDIFPKSVKGKAKCQEIIHNNPDLDILPILKCWPNDGGKFITLPLVHTKDPQTGIRNVGMYRMQILNNNITGMHWHMHKVGARHYNEYKQKGEKMPIAVALGGDPIYTYVATAPFPDNFDEYIFAGFMRKKPVEMVSCITQDIQVPADADIIIEGYVDPQEDLVIEGPFGDHTGFYSLPDYYPKFHVTCITHKKDAIYPATIVGIPPMEDYYLGKATEKIFLKPIQMALVPELETMELPAEGVAHNLTIVKINKRYPGQGLKVINSLWGAGQMMFNKVMIITSEETKDIYDLLDNIFKNVMYEQDIIINKGPLDILDHAASKKGLGGKIGIDATKKDVDEHAIISAKLIESQIVEVETALLKSELFENINLGLLKKGYPIIIANLQKNETYQSFIQECYQNISDIKQLFICIVDKPLVNFDLSIILWSVLNNIDPARDVYIDRISEKQFLFIDGRRKLKIRDNFRRDWPNVVVSADDTINYVNKHWNDYNLGGFIPSPSLKFKGLMFGDSAFAE